MLHGSLLPRQWLPTRSRCRSCSTHSIASWPKRRITYARMQKHESSSVLVIIWRKFKFLTKHTSYLPWIFSNCCCFHQKIVLSKQSSDESNSSCWKFQVNNSCVWLKSWNFFIITYAMMLTSCLFTSYYFCYPNLFGL